jgi:siroheme synthase
VSLTVTPGVSSIAAVPASALIPITHRGVSDRVTIASARGADGEEPDYASLVDGRGTIVLFMGLERLPVLAKGLVAAGLDPSTPASVVSNGTLPEQETVTGRIDEIAELAADLATPALVVVGDVVEVGARLRDAAVAREVPAVP